MQNFRRYGIPKAQLIIADVPYNVGSNFYGSNPMWYVGRDNKNGKSKLAEKAAFNSDFNFNLYEYFHFCSKMLKKEPKKAGNYHLHRYAEMVCHLSALAVGNIG